MYLYFWSFQFLATTCCIFGLAYLVVELKDAFSHSLATAVFFIIYTAMAFTVLPALHIVFKKRSDRLFPVPFICCCHCCHGAYCKVIANSIAIWISLAFLTYLLYSVPSILLAYYVFPSRTLIRLSFIQVAVVVLILALSLLLFLLEKTCLLCFLKHNSCQWHFRKNNLEGAPLIGELQGYTQGDDDPLEAVDHPKLAAEVEDTSSKRMCSLVLQVIAAAVFVSFLSALLIAIGAIVFKQTSNEGKGINSYLTILPTILVNVTIWFARKKIFVPEEISFLGVEGAQRFQRLTKQAQGMDAAAHSEETKPINTHRDGKRHLDYSSLP